MPGVQLLPFLGYEVIKGKPTGQGIKLYSRLGLM